MQCFFAYFKLVWILKAHVKTASDKLVLIKHYAILLALVGDPASDGVTIKMA